MKIILLILLLLFPTTLASQDTDDHLFLGMGNDLINYIPTFNRDDQYSYNINIDYLTKNYDVSLHLDAITNRGWKDNWQDNGESQYNGRYDIIDLSYKHKFNILAKNGYDIFINPTIGLKLIGDYSFVLGQDLVHNIVDLAVLTLEYEDDIYSPTINLETIIKKQTINGNYLSFTMKLDNNIFYQSSQDFIINYNLKNIFTASLGYSTIQVYSDNKTHKLLTEFNQGLYTKLNLDVGFLSISIHDYFHNKLGYEIISINALSFFNKPTYKKDDFSISIGLNISNYLQTSMLNLKFPINDSFSLVYGVQSILCKPMEDESTLKVEEIDYYRVQASRVANIISINYDLDLNYIRPFIKVGLGYNYSNFINYTNALKAAHAPIGEFEEFKSVIFNLNLGFSILPKDFIRLDNNSLRLVLAYNLDMYPMHKWELEYYSKRLSDAFIGYETYLNSAVSAITIALELGIDT